MNKLSLVLNAILAIAVGVLFYFHFSGKKDEVVVDANLQANRDSVSHNITMVYINVDSLWRNYKLVEELNEDLETQRKKMVDDVTRKSGGLETNLKNKGAALQKKVQEFQAKAEQMSEAIAQIKMQQLEEENQQLQQEDAQAQQEVYQYKERLGAQLMQVENDHNMRIQNTIDAYLEKYNKDHNYSVILARGTSGGVMLAHPALDITPEIIAGLNKEYEESKKAEVKEKK